MMDALRSYGAESYSLSLHVEDRQAARRSKPDLDQTARADSAERSREHSWLPLHFPLGTGTAELGLFVIPCLSLSFSLESRLLLPPYLLCLLPCDPLLVSPFRD